MAEAKQVDTAPNDASQSILSKIQRYTWIFRKWWWVILITVVLGVSWAAWTDSKKPPSYISTGRMMVNGRISMPEGVSMNEEMSNFPGTQARLMESSKVRKRAGDSLEQGHPELRACSVYLTATPERGTSFFNLTAIGEEPNYTQAFLSACMTSYIKEKRDMWQDLIAKKLTSLTDQQYKEDKDLDKALADLIDFQKKNNVVALGEEGNSAAKRLVALKERLATMKEEYQLLKVLDVDQNIERRQQSATANADGSTETDAAPLGAEGEYLQAKKRVQELKAEKERKSKVLRPKHPLMVKLDSDISQQEGLIQLFYDQNVAKLASKREELQKEIDTTEASIKDLSEKSLEVQGRLALYDKFKAKVDQAKVQNNSLETNYQNVTVNSKLQDDVINILDDASQAQPVKPGLAKDLSIGALCGVLIGTVIVFLIGFLDDRVTSAIELRERFPEQLLGHIPHESGAGAERVSMLSVSNKQGIFVEAYRNLRSTLHFMSLEEPRPKAFLITSAVPGEGKSTVAVNLGIILASGGSRTLLIDADLRKGLMHSYFEVESSPGLIEVLDGNAKWQDALVETKVKNLTLLPRGKGGVGPSEFFMSNASDEFLKEIYSAGYDRIIFDSAPILATDDTACLAPKVDATLFVVRAEASSMRLTRTALDALHKRQVNVLGLILNAANLRSSEYHYYHKYGDYYAESQSASKSA